MHDSLTLDMPTDVIEGLRCSFFLPCCLCGAHIRSVFVLLAYLYPDVANQRLLSLFC